MSKSNYISVTGLRIKSIWTLPRFYYFAIQSTNQARRADGNISVDVRAINGVQHTITMWESRQKMLKFMMSGAHKKAMKISHLFDDLYSYGYESDTRPSWDEAHRKWLEGIAAR